MKHFQNIIQKLDRVQQYLENDALDVIGIEAVNHFKDSFQKEGFTDTSLEKWKEVKRTDSASPWYGFKYKSTASRPGQNRKKEGGTTNYSDAATKRPILSGETQELLNAFEVRKSSRSVTVFNTKIYAQIHNEGGAMKVFGKLGSKMPKRQFMGKSAVLKAKLEKEITRDILRILK